VGPRDLMMDLKKKRRFEIDGRRKNSISKKKEKVSIRGGPWPLF
jgi:hypothetical protein